MKKIYLAFTLVLGLFLVSANNSSATSKNDSYKSDQLLFKESSLWLMGSKDNLKFSWEYSRVTTNTNTYGYVELFEDYKFKNDNPCSYLQVFREQKFWDFPIFMHAEYRFSTDVAGKYYDQFYFGPSYVWNHSRGYMALEPLLYVQEWKHVGAQFSFVGSVGWDSFSIEYFDDLMYIRDDLQNYLQLRFWLNPVALFNSNTNCKLLKNLRLGVIPSQFYGNSKFMDPEVYAGIKLIF